MSKRKMKLTPKKRVKLVENYLNGEDNMSNLARTANISWSTLKNWLLLYENGGPTALLESRKNTHYTIETKIQAVTDYLNGLGGLWKLRKNTD